MQSLLWLNFCHLPLSESKHFSEESSEENDKEKNLKERRNVDQDEKRRKKTKKIEKEDKKNPKKDLKSNKNHKQISKAEEKMFPPDKELALRTANYVAWAYWYVLDKSHLLQEEILIL